MAFVEFDTIKHKKGDARPLTIQDHLKLPAMPKSVNWRQHKDRTLVCVCVCVCACTCVLRQRERERERQRQRQRSTLGSRNSFHLCLLLSDTYQMIILHPLS